LYLSHDNAPIKKYSVSSQWLKVSKEGGFVKVNMAKEKKRLTEKCYSVTNSIKRSTEVLMPGLTRFGVSIDDQLIKKFDALIGRKGYTTRSEAIRDMIRDSLVEQEWEAENRETVGTITIVYNHHTRELEHALTDMQHKSYQQIISALHVHLDSHNCLEVLVVKGKSHEIKKIADHLIGTRGVKHGKLTMTTTGKELV
jgi:CopG family transcriptional regulator, nickel-responsive regulator